ARPQPVWPVRQRRVIETRPPRHHHRLHPDAGSDRRAGCRRPCLVKSSMGLMSDGMAGAEYTTLTRLIGSVLLSMQYYLLDNATAKVFGIATDLTEVFVVSVLEREQNGQLR